MKKLITLMAGAVLGIGTAAAQEEGGEVRPPHASMFLTAPAKAGTTICFPYYGDGTEYRVRWGMDTAWNDAGNVRRGTNYIGTQNMTYGRISFQPNDLVGEDLQLSTRQKSTLKSRVDNIKLSGTKEVMLNCDHEMLVADHYKDSNGNWKSGGEADWQASVANYKGTNMRTNWYRLIKASVKYAESLGVKVVSIAIFNEPDYTGWNEGSIADFKAIAKLLNEDEEMKGKRISAGNTLNCDRALEWYNGVKPYVQEGNTHQLAGEFDTYANFFTTVRNDGNFATADELHNVMEAMVGIEYGMQGGIWWGYDGIARGEFCCANVPGGNRLGYGENRSAWSAGSVYRLPDGRVKAFLGTSERQATTSNFEFVSTDAPVYYDGFGPQYIYQMEMPGGTGYQKGQTNAERMIHIYAGDDVPPYPLTDGNYVIINKKSKLAMSAGTGNNPTNGANICQRAYTGKNSRASQQWKLEAVSPRIGGDFSYCYIRCATNDKLLLDVTNWSVNAGGTLMAYEGGGGALEQWNLEYAGDGDWYIRSRHSGLYLQTKGGSIAANATIEQAVFTGQPQQRWRIVPTDVERELEAPAQPTGLTATPRVGSVELTWNANSEADLDGYMVLRGRTLEDNTVRWSVIGRRIQGNTFVDNSAQLGVTYIYKVRALDRCCNLSEPSESITAATSNERGLVAKYQFDQETLDQSPHYLDAVMSGKATYSTSSTLKKSGTASLNMNGTSHYLALPVSLGSMRQMTLCTWVRWSGGTSWQRLFDFGNGTDQYVFLTPSNGSEMRLVLKNGGDEQILAATKLKTGSWQHVAVTMDETTVRIFINGEEIAATNDITLRPSDICSVRNYIGRSQFDRDPFFKGQIDDLRLYNYALTAAELAEVMDDTANGIEEIISSPSLRKGKTDVVYDLQGRKVEKSTFGVHHSELAPGIYLVNGKKVLVK